MQRVIVSAVFGALAITTDHAQNSSDLRQECRLALDVCASCHAVRAGQTRSPLATALSFEEIIASTPGMTAAALAFWLTAASRPLARS